ncbi:TrlF family AAA-like ATPase [Glutamicibacter arilaitensis]|uniref:TrlF family AAA-like ATPase n=1 Tax=Glutamicibacter arilaitensis TaxID=256701 RepID=UPI003FD14896
MHAVTLILSMAGLCSLIKFLLARTFVLIIWGVSVDKVENFSQGAGWFRAALQVNPFGYVGHPAPSQTFATEAEYNTALLDECEAQGISMLAVTDHWKASTAAGLIADASNRNITILPGFEANCSEGFHLLVIFEAGTDLDFITAAIGACGVPADDPHGPGDKSFSDVVAQMASKGALIIPAHVNVATSGLLARESGKPLQNIIKSDHILAMGTTPSQRPLGDQKLIIDNKKPYRRAHRLVEIYADDVSHPSSLNNVGATTWFKMAHPSLRGLQHALRTPETRVRLSPPLPLRGTKLRAISWTGGFLDGLRIPIGPELTALIGGRGTGKSTVIESLRFALDQPPVGENSLRDHTGVVQKVLGAGTIVRLEIEKYEPNPAQYVIQRTVGDPPLVLDASGTRTQQLPSDIVGVFEAFGQHELAELAHDKNMLAALIRRLGGDFPSEARRPLLVEKLGKNRTELRETERLQGALETELADVPRLQEQANKFNETDLGSKLDAHRSINDERAMFDEFDRRIQSVNGKIDSIGSKSLIEELRTQLHTSGDSSRLEHLETAKKAITDVSNEIETAFAAISQAVNTASAELELSRASWVSAVEPDLQAHASTVRLLVEQGYDPDTYLKTTAALTARALRAEEGTTLDTRHETLLAERQKLLGELAVLEREIAVDLHSAISATNAATGGKVNVRPTPSPDRSSIRSVIDTYFKTQRNQIMAAIEADDFSVASFVQAVRGGPPALLSYGITGAQATNLIGHGEALLREMEEHSVGLAVDVLLNVATDGSEFRKLDDLSKGQRATALLLLLLSVSTTPLVIDQPEDDLDNRFVYDGIVKHLRDLKGTRQILVSTHNANVPVLGDAELVVVLESNGRRGCTAADGVGSLDEASIRNYAERILEGGEEAFRARRHLYGF